MSNPETEKPQEPKGVLPKAGPSYIAPEEDQNS
jgi:hypothetical protein